MKKILIATIVIFTLPSCETVIEYKIPEEETKMTIDTRIIAGDSIGALVGTTSYSMSNESPDADSLSTVILLEDGVQVAQLEPREARYSFNRKEIFTYHTGFIPQQGKVYTLEAYRPGVEKAIGQASIPAAVPLTSYTFDEDKRQLEVSFKDPAGKGDYYRFEIMQGAQSGSDVIFTTSDPIVEVLGGFDDPLDQNQSKSSDVGYLSDELFNGGTKRISMTLDYINTQSGMPLLFLLTRISKDFYLHEKSKAAYFDSDGFFIEPTQVYSNITNGYGIVAGGARSVTKVYP